MPRKSETGILDIIFDVFKKKPFWTGPLVALIGFVSIRYIAPALLPAPTPGRPDMSPLLRGLCPIFSWFIPGIILFAWVVAEIWKFSNRHLLNSQRDLATIRNLSWPDFERLIAEAYRRQGFTAEVTGSTSNDGGVDVLLTRPGEKILVQCKQWKAGKVGVRPVRELLGVVVSHHATKGILITSGQFTSEAQNFAAQNSEIQLIAGPELASLIANIQNPPVTTVSSSSPQPSTRPACPTCGSSMTLRVARKGQNPGSQFWGCPRYPACRGTRPQS